MTDEKLKILNALKGKVYALRNSVNDIEESIAMMTKDKPPFTQVKITHVFHVKKFWGSYDSKSVDFMVDLNLLISIKEKDLKIEQAKLEAAEQEYNNF